MIIYRNIIIFIVLHLAIVTLNSQEVGIGEWRDHLPYNKGISVTSSNNIIYCATPYSLFYLDKTDNSLNRFTSISGLNDIGIAKIGYNEDYNTLLVAYENTNIDLIVGSTIINMADILNSDAVTPEEKIINNFIFIDSKAYITCGFGIVVLDIDNHEVSETYYIGPEGSHIEVFDITYNDTSFFAATESGIYTARMDDSNLSYYESWSKIKTLPDPDATYNHIAKFSNKIFTNKYSEEYEKDTILYYEGNQWIVDDENFGHGDVQSIRAIEDRLYILHSYQFYVYDEDINILSIIWNYYDGTPNPSEVTLSNGIVWIADGQQGLVEQVNNYAYNFYHPNGPGTTDVFDISVENGHLWTVAGGRNLSWNNTWRLGNSSNFIDNSWESHSQKNTPAYDTILDLLCVAVNPFNSNNVFIGSWFKGLVEFNGQELVNVYNPDNSTLEYDINQGGNVTKIGGLVFDNIGNLWMTNSSVNNSLVVKMLDGTWKSFYLGSFSSGKSFGEMIIDDYDQKWLLWREGSSLVVYTDNGTITDHTDDEVKKLTSAEGNGGLDGNLILSIASDLDGEIWIGSDEGISVIYSPENVFTNYNFDAQRILIPRNDGSGLADILLEFETISAIAVDGANNKWIGTDRSGVYHLSPDGQQELNHFTAENSPLFSDNITSLAIDNQSGEVFIGTDKGIISYKSTATEGGDTYSDVYAYPNPVRPGYTGPIAIKGLVNNADFKITDISGSLISSGSAEGGQAIWDGNNFEGRRAQSGVYLVFVTDETGSETLVTKILFIN